MHVHFLVLQLAIKCKCHNKVGLDQDRTDLKVVSAQSLTLGVSVRAVVVGAYNQPPMLIPCSTFWL